MYIFIYDGFKCFAPTYLQEEMVRSLNYKEASLGFSVGKKCPYLEETEILKRLSTVSLIGH